MRVNVNSKGDKALGALMSNISSQAVIRAARSGVTFVAKDYASHKTSRIESDIDRPRAFTKRAFTWQGADRNSNDISARAYVRPIQAKYLELPEFGGTKDRAKGERAYGIREDRKDRYGGGWGSKGFQRKWLNRTKAKVLSGKGKTKTGRWRSGTKLHYYMTLKFNGGDHTGIWEKTKTTTGWKLQRIVKPLEKAEYDNPRLNFRKDALEFGKTRLPKTINRLLSNEIKKARRKR